MRNCIAITQLNKELPINVLKFLFQLNKIKNTTLSKLVVKYLNNFATLKKVEPLLDIKSKIYINP